MKVNHQLKACVLAALCLSLPAALKADDARNVNTTANSDSTASTAIQKSSAAGDTENVSPATTSPTMANQDTGAMNQNNMGADSSRPYSRSAHEIVNAAPMEVTANNRASSIIGMEVRNNSDEKLGRIKDIVLDFQSGRISYAVMDGGTLFKSKLFAIPLNAFSPSTDQNYLILNADKSKIETAQGFDKDSWPTVNNPDWGASTGFLPEQPASNWQPAHHWNKDRNSIDKQNAPTASPTYP